MKRFSLCLLVLLAACGTPQERCISGATRDMRTLDRLIEEAEGNIRRGYAYQEETTYVPVWEPCFPAPVTPPGPDGHPQPARARMCLDEQPRTTRKAVAIDLAAEARKLDGLKAKRQSLGRAAAPAIDQCKKAYPQ